VAIAERMQATPAANDNVFGVDMPGRISVRQVLEVTAAHFGTTAEALTADTRKWPIVRRRQMAMYVARRLTGRSLPFIARNMGRKDHSTVLHAVRGVQALIDAGDTDAIAAVNAIVEAVTGGAA
jgi:chromosomal replication initiator protein